jgi:hypothetical protein
MRKVDPADVRTAFKSELNEILAGYRRTAMALLGTGHAQADISRLSSGTFLVCYVAFERFVSDILLAYLNRDFSIYRKDLQSRVLQSVEGKFKKPVARRTRVRIPDHPSVAEVEAFVAADGRNVTFSDTKALKERAASWLGKSYAARIGSLSRGDAAIVDAAHSIRDFIAHRSPSSRSWMNEKLRAISAGPTAIRHLGRGVNEIHSVGSFLKASHRGVTRLEGYVIRLRDIAQTM